MLAKTKFAIERNGNDNKDLNKKNMDSVPEKKRKKELLNVFSIGWREWDSGKARFAERKCIILLFLFLENRIFNSFF